MVNKQVSAKFLISLDSDSHSKIRDYLDPDCGEAIVVCQKYRFIDGCDVAIWEHFPGKGTIRTVIGTGPVRQTPCVDVSSLQVSEDSSVPRSVRLRQALAQLSDMPDAPSTNIRLSIDNACEVDAGELDNVLEILSSIQDGCENVLGTDSIVWALTLKDGTLNCITKSWDGTVAFNEYWERMNRVLALTGIHEFP